MLFPYCYGLVHPKSYVNTNNTLINIFISEIIKILSKFSLFYLKKTCKLIMKTILSVFINSIHPLSDEVLEDVLQHFQELEYPKNFFLLKQGKTCEYLWFLTKGAVRYFYTDNDGKDSNVWFSIDRDIVVDTPSFLYSKPAEANIQLLEDCELFAISRNSITNLLIKHHPFALWYIKLFEMYYVNQIEDRIGDLQFLTAKQRYEKLLAQFPSISQRISLGHIASYLNITQETLSRIRAGKL